MIFAPNTTRYSWQRLCLWTTLLLLTATTVSGQVSSPIPVSLKQQDGGWVLLRGGKPYQVRGAGGVGSLAQLAAYGGNSNRLWGVDQATKSRLDEAHENGISVALGIWLEHERHGFDYSDEAAVEQQAQEVLKAVREFKNHPAVLVWGIGNEMEGDGSNKLVWKHIEDLCQRVKKEDPNHPTMSVIAEMGGTKIEDIHKMCPSLDIVGINSYGGATSVPDRYREHGGTKPYIVTEFGPIGTWEVGKNNIDAIEEPTSGQKAKSYRAAYEAFQKDRQHCLGSYAFLWGDKQEATPTWFGMLLPNGKKLAAVDTMSELWTGSKPKNLCPTIEQMVIEGGNRVEGEELVKIKLVAKDPERKILQTNWVVLRDAQQYVTGGDKQSVPPDFSSSIKRSGLTGATIKAPTLSGRYRVYAYVDDGNGAAVANVPFLVAGKNLENPGKKVKLPYVVFDEPNDDILFAPSGWMGNADGIVVENSKDQPKFGKTCVRCQYNANSGWAGVVWQNPENDWGDKAGGVDVSGATKLTFWVRGKTGNEKVKFGFGLIGQAKPYFDTAKKEMEVKLDRTWKQVTLDVSGMDLRRIKSGFFWSAASEGEPLTFYLDRIRFE